MRFDNLIVPDHLFTFLTVKVLDSSTYRLNSALVYVGTKLFIIRWRLNANVVIFKQISS